MLNFELRPLSANFGKLVGDLSNLITTNTNALLVFGLVAMSLSSLLITFVCYHKLRTSQGGARSRSPGIGKTLGSVRFLRYNEIDERVGRGDSVLRDPRKRLNQSTQRSAVSPSTSTKLFAKPIDADKRRLLADMSDDDDDGDNIFVR